MTFMITVMAALILSIYFSQKYRFLLSCLMLTSRAHVVGLRAFVFNFHLLRNWLGVMAAAHYWGWGPAAFLVVATTERHHLHG